MKDSSDKENVPQAAAAPHRRISVTSSTAKTLSVAANNNHVDREHSPLPVPRRPLATLSYANTADHQISVARRGFRTRSSLSTKPVSPMKPTSQFQLTREAKPAPLQKQEASGMPAKEPELLSGGTKRHREPNHSIFSQSASTFDSATSSSFSLEFGSVYDIDADVVAAVRRRSEYEQNTKPAGSYGGKMVQVVAPESSDSESDPFGFRKAEERLKASGIEIRSSHRQENAEQPRTGKASGNTIEDVTEWSVDEADASEASNQSDTPPPAATGGGRARMGDGQQQKHAARSSTRLRTRVKRLTY
ncbi:hypothetical protein HDU83_008969 [Entophlyctis luteolus]|nr:hypothetical protein HDU82_006729 [Entophlyctis luteolus]KAJ3351346.1 hypothetical protein HDU83_008969 [Entophlyctis luteolus]